MALPVVKQGPFKCSLRSTSLFIAWFSLIILFITLAAILLIGVDKIQTYAQQPEGTAVTAKQFAEIVGVVTCGIIVTLIVFNILLLVGIHKENTCLIFSYICVKGSFILLTYLGSIQILVTGQFTAANIGSLLFTVIDTYFIFLLYSYYRELKEFGNGRVYDNQSGFKA